MKWPFYETALKSVDTILLRGHPGTLPGQNHDFEKSFCGPLRGHPGTLRGQNGDFEKSFCGPFRGQIKTYQVFFLIFPDDC